MGIVRTRWVGLVALLAAEAMNLLDATVVQVIGPTMHAEFGGPAATVQWFSAAYTLPFALLLITGGRLGDAFGRRRVFLIGVSVFALASVACAVAPSPGLLIASRVVQGAAAAAIIPQTFAGLLNAVQQLGATLGVAVLGAVFLHDLGHSGPAAAVEQTFWVALALTGLAAATAAAMRTSTSRMVGVGR